MVSSKQSSPSRRDDAQWVRQIRRGDRDAYKALFYTYYEDLCIFAARYVGSHDRGRDVVQTVFAVIWERRADWKVHTSLKAYLYQAVRNRGLNAKRAARRRQAVTPSIDEVSPRIPMSVTDGSPLQFKQLNDAVWRAVHQLPERRRMVFLLHRQHGCTYAEIAQIMGITPKTVENQMGRALKTLREQLAPEYIST